jgi:hypothetical protein
MSWLNHSSECWMQSELGGALHWCVWGFFVVVMVGGVVLRGGIGTLGCCGICRDLQNGRYRENKVDIMKKRLIKSIFG